jgi:hypothetical protein
MSPGGSRVQALSVLLRRAARQARGACSVMDEVYDALRSNAGLRLSYVQRARLVLEKPMPAALAPYPLLQAAAASPLPELFVAPSEELRVRLATIAVCLGELRAIPGKGQGSRRSRRARSLPPARSSGPTRLPFTLAQSV